MTRTSIGGEWVYIEETTGVFAVKETSWTVHDELFMTTENSPHVGYTTYTPKRALPRSCIESAEFALQVKHDPGLKWKEGEERNPHMLATFGGKKMLDATSSPDLANDVTGVTSYPFVSLPRVGEGVIIANRTNTDHTYNMHLGAVVARHNGKEACILTDLAESGKVKMVIPWSIKLIRTVDDFRGSDYAGPDFALGLLTTK
jgi:hypothetical protein